MIKVPYHKPQPELTGPAEGAGLEQAFAQAADFMKRTLCLADGNLGTLYYLEGMVRTERLNDYVIRPLVTNPLGRDPLKSMEEGGVWTSGAKRPENLEEVCVALTCGDCAVELREGMLLLPVATEEKRSVETPEDEPSLKGSKDSFVESLRTNTSLVRRRLHTWRLGIRSFTIGRESRTAVELLWIEGITDPDLVDRAAKRLSGLDVDAILNTELLTDTLTDSQRSIFPLTEITQRPDRFTQGLLDGQVGVVCDGIAQGWLVPGTAARFFQVPQDKDDQWVISRVLVTVRYICTALSLILPGGYISMAAFNFGLMPVSLAETISAARQGVPIPPPLEVVLLLLAFEILQEAGQHLPQLNGQSVSIIGSLVVGQAAVQAKLLSPVVVVVVAAAGIAGYTMPNQDLADALRMVRFYLAVLSAFFGLFGFTLGLCWLCCHISELDPLEVPWLAPFAPDTPAGPCDATGVPVRRARLRSLFFHPENLRREK